MPKKESQEEYRLTIPFKINVPVSNLFGYWTSAVRIQLEMAIKNKTKKEIVDEVKKVLKLFK